MLQRYVSGDLTHFVGASLRPDENTQYALLRDIIRGGVLRNPRFGDGFAFGLSPVADDLGESLSAPVVCFCDLPVADLVIHLAKYGRFGIAFRKEFLIRQGANPVFYVVKQASSQPMFSHVFHYDRPAVERGANQPPNVTIHGPQPWYRLFEFWKYALVRMLAYAEEPAPGTSTTVTGYEFMHGSWWADATEFLSLYIFGYVKYVDAPLKDDDPKNFYMEREWRVLRRVNFQRSDISRVLLPEPFAKRFRSDFPDFAAEVLFLP